jgi:colanic acid/amylovoran biosynthesis protein
MLVPDFFASRGTPPRGRVARFRARLRPYLMWFAARPGLHGLRRLLTRTDQESIERIRDYDVVIQVGGSFFVDLYGLRQFETPFAALIADRPLILLGHSIGPAQGRAYPMFLKRLLTGARVVALRERISHDLLGKLSLLSERVTEGADTAWLVERPDRSPSRPAGDRPKVAITLRELAPFDRRLGITQSEYEQGFVRLVDHLIGRNYQVVALSNCTGIESYHRDDRINALRLKQLVRDPSHFEVVMDELSDLEIGEYLRDCDLIIGTRLHSAIIAMNFGTPAIAINYEHKSEGIMNQLGLPQCSASVRDLLDGTLIARVDEALAGLDDLRKATALAVAAERQRARDMVLSALDGLREASTVSGTIAPPKVQPARVAATSS